MADTADDTAEGPLADGSPGSPAAPWDGTARGSGGAPQLTVSSLLRRLQVVILAPFGILVALSGGSFVYAGYLTVQLVLNSSWSANGVSDNIVKALQVVDVCLIGTAALVIAAEALVMFMANPDGFRPPTGKRWWGSDGVDVLKNRALSMVVLILVVSFLEGVVHPRNGRSELEFGLAVAVVIVAIALYLLASRPSPRLSSTDAWPERPPRHGHPADAD